MPKVCTECCICFFKRLVLCRAISCLSLEHNLNVSVELYINLSKECLHKVYLDNYTVFFFPNDLAIGLDNYIVGANFCYFDLNHFRVI